MATILDSLLGEPEQDKRLNGTPCNCGHCPRCLTRSTGAHANWRERRNARYAGTDHETSSPKGRSSVAPKSRPGGAARVIPIRGTQRQAMQKKWTDRSNNSTHPKAKERYGRYAETVRDDGRPSADQSEKDLLPLFRRPAQLWYKPGRVIQILNFNIGSPYSLIRRLSGQARRCRGRSFPLMVIDLRGQEKNAGNPLRLIDRLARQSRYPAGRIKIVTW